MLNAKIANQATPRKTRFYKKLGFRLTFLSGPLSNPTKSSEEDLDLICSRCEFNHASAYEYLQGECMPTLCYPRTSRPVFGVSS